MESMTLEQQRALALATARLRMQQGTPEPATKPSIAEKIAGSAPVRFAVGAAEPILGGAQLLANVAGLGDKRITIPNPMGDTPLFDSSINEHMRSMDQTIERGRGPDAGFDFARFGGNVLSPVNAAFAKAVPAAATTSGRMAVGAGAGGAGGALMPVTSGEDFWANKGAQVGTGMVAGGVFAPVAGKLMDAIGPRIERALSSRSGAASPDEVKSIVEVALKEIGADDVPAQMRAQIAVQVAEALKAGKKLDATALARKADFDALKIPPTQGQITRDPTQFAQERNLRGADPRLTTRFNEQNRAISEVLRKYGGDAAAPPQMAGQEMADALAKLDKGMASKVSDAYKVARESAGRDLDVPLQGLAQDMERISRDYGSALPDAIRSRLGQFGIFGTGNAGNQAKAFTVNDAEQVLQQINKLRGSDKATNNALSEVAASIKQAITQADDAGGVFAAPRNLASKRFQLQDAVPALKAAADGDVNADKFVSQYLLNGQTKDVQMLAELLKASSPEMFDQARAQFGAALMRKAYGENPAADAVIKPAQLAKALRDFGPEKLKAFYTPSEIEQLQRVARVGGYIESLPAASPVNTSNSFTAALPSMLQLIPGGEKVGAILRAGAAIGRGVGNENTVARALKADVPVTPADMSPEARRRLARALVVGGAGAGIATSSGFKE